MLVSLILASLLPVRCTLAAGPLQETPPKAATAVEGQPQKQGEQPKKPVCYTQFGAEVLAKVDAVLLGKVAEVTTIQGTDVVRVTVTSWRVGQPTEGSTASQESVTLLAATGDFFAGTEQLLFLRRYESGPRFTVFNRIARSDPEWEAKLACLDDNLALGRIEKDEDRRREARKMLYDGLAARSSWSRWHAWQELRWVRKERSDLVTKGDRDDMRRLMERSEDAKLKSSLLALLKEWDQ